MYVSLDACFRIKRYDISDDEKDPVMDDGMAYFVKRGPYKEQLKKYKGQNAVSLYPQIQRKFTHLCGPRCPLAQAWQP